MKKNDIPKAHITKLSGYNVCLDGYVYSCKTEAEAKALKKKLEKEAREAWEEKNSDAVKRQESLEDLEDNLRRYVEMLRKDNWHLVRNKDVSKREKANMKSIIDDLSGVLSGTKKFVGCSLWN